MKLEEMFEQFKYFDSAFIHMYKSSFNGEVSYSCTVKKDTGSSVFELRTEGKTLEEAVKLCLKDSGVLD